MDNTDMGRLRPFWICHRCGTTSLVAEIDADGMLEINTGRVQFVCTDPNDCYRREQMGMTGEPPPCGMDDAEPDPDMDAQIPSDATGVRWIIPHLMIWYDGKTGEMWQCVRGRKAGPVPEMKLRDSSTSGAGGEQ